MVPPKRRAALSSSIHTGTDWLRTGLRRGGQTLYVVSTSVILVGLTWTMAFVDDAQAAEAEKELRMQQSANEVCLFSLSLPLSPQMMNIIIFIITPPPFERGVDRSMGSGKWLTNVVARWDFFRFWPLALRLI